MKRAIIKKVSKGRQKGEYRFLLIAENGEIIATSETYTAKHNVVDVIKAHFPEFTIVDKTKEPDDVTEDPGNSVI
jgi:uncharacterized protein YegP (UPF0339 family)